jgi:hypothetical protein
MAKHLSPDISPVRRRLLHFGAGLASVLGASLVFDGGAFMAVAQWMSGGSGAGQSIAQNIPQGSPPVAIADGRNVTVTWNQTHLSGGTAASGYLVHRHTEAGGEEIVLDDCDGTVEALSCTEVNVPIGTWRYTVRPLLAGWTGTESEPSAATVVGDSHLAFTSSTSIDAASLPADLDGTLTNFEVDEPLTFHLDGPTGLLLTGTPSVVDGTGAATVSVTIPDGTDNAPHSVFAVGDFGSLASASFAILDEPTLMSLEARDVDADGKIDRVIATFSKNLAPYSAGVTPWTLTAVPSGGSLASVTVSGAVATLTLIEGGGSPTTALGLFAVALAENDAGIRDVNGQLSSFAPTAPDDGAAPALVGQPAMNDVDADGRVDEVTMTFSEPLAAYSADISPWSLTDIPSAGTLAAVTSPTATTLTLTIAEGAGPFDTAVGTFRLTLAADATGVRDAADNRTTFAAVAPADAAKPVRVSDAAFDDTVNGKFDRVAVTFSETLAASTAGPTGWTFVSKPSGMALNTVSVSGAVATLALGESTAATTAVGAWTVSLATNVNGIRDAAGNLSSYAAVSPADQAAPALTATPQLLDGTPVNGKVDRVTIVLSEPLLAYTAGAVPWTLTDVPSGATLASVDVVNGATTATVTLVLNEGPGALDTAVGAMTVAMATDAVGGARDASGNAGAFTAVSPLDKAKPFRASQNAYDDSGNGKFDRIAVTFSETLATYTANKTGWALTAPPTGLTLNSVTASGTVATLLLNEGTGITTGPGTSWKVTLSANAAGIRDAADNRTNYAAATLGDMARPIPLGPPKLYDAAPTVLNGKVDRFTITMSEFLGTFTAGAAPWTLAGVPSGGTTSSTSISTNTVTVTLSEGAGAADTTVGAMTVAMASDPLGLRDLAGNVALAIPAIAPLDLAKPARLLHEAYDDDGNGKLDRLTATFSETLAPYTAGNTGWTFVSPPTGMTLNNVTVSGTVATLAMNEGTAKLTSVASAWRVGLTANAAGIRDVAGNLTNYSSLTLLDRAAPVMVTTTLQDIVGGDGVVDRVAVLFSETLSVSTLRTNWTLTDVPSGGTLTTAAASTTSMLLTLTGGAVVDSTVGSMTVALAANATGVKDAANNLASFAAVTPIDGAGPAPAIISDTDGAIDGRIEPGDSVSFTLSEPLGPAVTLPSTVTVTIDDPVGGTFDFLQIPGILSGSRTLSSNEHIVADGTSAVFDGSTVLLSGDRQTITITVGPTCTGTACGAGIGTNTVIHTFGVLLDPALRDQFGVAPPTAVKNRLIRLF